MLALIRRMVWLSERNALQLFRQVSVDVERLRQRMGERWKPLLAYAGGPLAQPERAEGEPASPA